MKLQYNTVEYNIKELNEKIGLLSKACNKPAGYKYRQIMEQINDILFRLRESIKRGHWSSKELTILNGPSTINPSVFYIAFYKKN